MPDYSGADLFVDALADYGVTHLFGNPGTTELPIMQALAGQDEIEYVLGLHEDVAVGMAAGYAQARRYHAHDDPSVTPLGVVNLHVAPGVAHGLGNLYNADWADVPLLVTAGGVATEQAHREPILAGDTVEMTRQFTKDSTRVQTVAALPTVLRRAVKTALTPPTGPVFLALPQDVMRAETDDRPERLGPIPRAGPGDPDGVDRAADLLATADEPVLVVGDGVGRSGASALEAAVDLAEVTGARVYGERLRAEVDFPTTHDQWCGRTAGSIEGADVVAFVGCSTNYALGGRDPIGDTRFVHVGDDPWQVGKNQPADATVIGDPGVVLARLADRLAERVPAAERERRLERVAEARADTDGGSTGDDDGSSGDDDGSIDGDGDPRPSKTDLVRALMDVTTDVFLVDEGVTASGPLVREWPLEGGEYLGAKGYGLGYGLPAAIGAAVAEAERGTGRQVVAYVGDGSSLYYPQALYSAVRAGVDLAVVVPDNRGYFILKRNTANMFGGDVADFEHVGMDFDPAVDLPGFARAQGAEGHLAETAAEVSEAFAAALEAGGVHLIDAPVRD